MKRKALLLLILLMITFLCFFPIQSVNGAPLYEDFTTYTEVEPNDRIQKTANHVDYADARDETAYLYKDYGLDFFGSSFEHLIQVNRASHSTKAIAVFYMLSNSIGDQKDIVDMGGDAILLDFYVHLTGGKQLRLLEIVNGVLSNIDYTSYIEGTTYYVKITRSEISISAKFYSDEARENLLFELDGILSENNSYRYLYVSASYDTALASATGTLDVDNLELKEAVTITFYNNSGGILKINGTTISNGTSKAYGLNQVIELGALPLNSSYRFLNFTWDSNYNETNPYNLTILTDLTLWCYFDKPSTFSIGLGSGFILALLIALALIVSIVAISQRRS